MAGHEKYGEKDKRRSHPPFSNRVVGSLGSSYIHFTMAMLPILVVVERGRFGVL